MQPAGDEDATVLVCVLSGWHVPQAEYVNEVQVVGVDAPSAARKFA